MPEKPVESVEDHFDVGDTRLDMSQPDGVPPEKPRDPDTGKFVKAEEPPEAPKPKHPAYLVKQAQELGFTEAELADVSTDFLGNAVHRLLRQQIDARREEPRREERKEEPEPEEEVSLKDFGINEADYDEAYLKVMKAAIGGNRKELKALKKQLEERERADNARRQQENIDLIDEAFDSLPEEYQEYFGKGSVHDLAKTDPEALNARVLAMQKAGVDPNNISPRKIAAQVKAGADKLVAKFLKKPEKEEEKPNPYNGKAKRFTKEEWDRGGTAHPTQAATKEEAKGTDLAIRNAAKRLGQTVTTASDQEIDDTLF